MLQAKGEIPWKWFNDPENEKWKETLKRCKARGMVVPVRHETAYWYDLSDFGYDMLTLIQAKKQEGVFAPKVAHAEAVKPLDSADGKEKI